MSYKHLPDNTLLKNLTKLLKNLTATVGRWLYLLSVHGFGASRSRPPRNRTPYTIGGLPENSEKTGGGHPAHPPRPMQQTSEEGDSIEARKLPAICSE